MKKIERSCRKKLYRNVNIIRIIEKCRKFWNQGIATKCKIWRKVWKLWESKSDDKTQERNKNVRTLLNKLPIMIQLDIRIMKESVECLEDNDEMEECCGKKSSWNSWKSFLSEMKNLVIEVMENDEKENINGRIFF